MKFVESSTGRLLPIFGADFFAVAANGNATELDNVPVTADYVVVMRPAGPRVALAGALDSAAVYELKSCEEPLRGALRYADGQPVLASPNRAQLEHVDPAQRAARSVEAFPLDAAGLAKPLRDGDALTLLAISPEFANAVTLKGHNEDHVAVPFGALTLCKTFAARGGACFARRRAGQGPSAVEPICRTGRAGRDMSLTCTFAMSIDLRKRRSFAGRIADPPGRMASCPPNTFTAPIRRSSTASSAPAGTCTTSSP